MEVLAVPTSLFKFHYGKEAGRTEAVGRLQEIMQKTVPGASVTRASWIHGKKTQEKRQKGSLIIYLSQKEDQEKAILRGVVVEGWVHTTLLYSSQLRNPQCFKCSCWGHTQTTCKAKESCGYCAGGHNT